MCAVVGFLGISGKSQGGGNGVFERCTALMRHRMIPNLGNFVVIVLDNSLIAKNGS